VGEELLMLIKIAVRRYDSSGTQPRRVMEPKVEKQNCLQSSKIMQLRCSQPRAKKPEGV
jgi:hypothetical protein